MGTKMKRRQFMKKSIAASSMLAMPQLFCSREELRRRPNILVILTDQQSATMMSCAGNKYLHTPAMDGLAQSGVRFERAYCADPVCVPSRFSLMTGRMPGKIGLRSNDSKHINSIPDMFKENALGNLFKRAGYDTAYGGKVHLPKMNAEDIGFDYICKNERDELARVCADYVKQPRENPFLLVASFINPHDICYMALRDFAKAEREKRIVSRGVTEIEKLDLALELPNGVSRDEFFEKYCPPLPNNFASQQDEPEAIKWLLSQRKFRQQARHNWTEQRWREHRWAYCRLSEMVDPQIGNLLNAQKKRGQAENTIVVFTSDHGDMDAAHKLEHKTAFYEEACRIPLIINGPGITKKGFINNEHLVSNGLDLIPTLCDFAGIEVPTGLKGKSLRPLVERKKTVPWRSALPVESELGKMIVTKRYKYMRYDKGKNEEQLIDLQKNPGEMQSVTNDPDKKEILLKHRKLFNEIYSIQNDSLKNV